VDGDTDAAVDASEEEATSASCSWRRSWSCVSAKAGMDMGVGGAMVARRGGGRCCLDVRTCK
jgi:hypothetical protein